MTHATLRRGRDGEALAARHLEERGYRIVARGYRTRFGEMDLIATQGPTLVFVEVKTRRLTGYGSPAEAVHGLKQSKLARVAAHFLQSSGHPAGSCRFDVIAITWKEGQAPRLEHIEDAFRL